jgi:hypothetical protein
MVDSRTGEPYGEGAFAIQLEGVFTNEDQARRVADLIKGGFLQGVSVDMSDVDFTLDLVDADGNPVDTEADDFDDSGVMLQQTITAGRIMGATVLPFEAFEAAFIELVDDDGNAGPATTPGRPTPKQQAAAVRASAPVYQPRACAPCESGAIVAAAAPVLPPRAWFVDPCLTEPTPITVTDAGQVFGHLALWDTCHIGHSGQCVTPPRSATNYALFNRKPIPTADGDPVQIGPLTVGTGHADTKPGTGMFAAISHYDNTGHVAADVTAGEDELGIWVAGALRPDATPEQVRVLRASSISGDWRDWGGNLELGAILAVNTPGFPVLRQVVASGRPMALIAVGPAPSTTPAELAEIRALLPDLQAAAERERRARDLTATRAHATRGRMRALSAAAQRDRMGSMG